MKTCTGKEKLTRGWWVNQNQGFWYAAATGSLVVLPRCELGDVFWWCGRGPARPAPPGRELVGFVVKRVGGTSPPGWYVHAYGTYHGRYVFNTYDEAKKALDLSCWPVGDYRILPVTRRKRDAKAIDTHDCEVATDRAVRADETGVVRKLPDGTLEELTPVDWSDPAQVAKRRAFLAECEAVYTRSRRPKSLISLSDALDDQMRGCLRISGPSACPSFFSENDHEAFRRMWHGNDSVCLSDLMDKKP